MGLMKSYYTALHTRGGNKAKIRREAAKAEAWIGEQIKMSFMTDEEFRAWELKSARRVFDECTACPLHHKRRRVVHGSGNSDPLLLVVGSAPYADSMSPYDDFTKEGRLLRASLDRLGYDLDRDAWITHAVACATPARRRLPTSEERGACKRGRLSTEVGIVRPRVILLLGDSALRQVLFEVERSAKVADYAGLVDKKYWPRLELGTCGAARLRAVFATYEPGEILAARGTKQGKSMVSRFGKDLRNVKRVLDKLNEKRTWR